MARIRTACVGIALFVLAGSAAAEVRVQRRSDGATLQVVPTRRGPWTPAGAVDVLTLNPGGDLLGDGYPAHEAHGGEILAAWNRPASSQLALARWQGFGWSQWAVELEGGIATPVVVSLGGAWLVAWNETGVAGPSVRTATVTGAGPVLPVATLAGGHLAAAWAEDDTALLLTLEPASGDDSGEVVVYILLPPHQPIDVSRVQLGLIRPPLEPIDVLRGRRSDGVTSADLRVHDLRPQREASVVTWWATPRELQWVVVDETGPQLPTSAVTTRIDHAPSAVPHALQLARQE
jgi:hypothetical protein